MIPAAAEATELLLVKPVDFKMPRPTDPNRSADDERRAAADESKAPPRAFGHCTSP